ncbi:hypothetical protein AB205_0216680 [Aquarana catesbeiana]|uniref:Uncharacterized protein n=1 Tax=Aquarana catesbeiana TaxID=8400 RepID=A0A2G9NAU5_AQUCT|nr:hypothetical protein AB205_0216680 [Aquarana catesbeiana]
MPHGSPIMSPCVKGGRGHQWPRPPLFKNHQKRRSVTQREPPSMPAWMRSGSEKKGLNEEGKKTPRKKMLDENTGAGSRGLEEEQEEEEDGGRNRRNIEEIR